MLSLFNVGSVDMTEQGRQAMHGDVLISPVTVWELTRKATLGKLPPLPTLEGSFTRRLEALGFKLAPLSWADAEASNRLPPHHRDPMDRMLIATATRLALPVITSDRIFAAYGLKTVW